MINRITLITFLILFGFGGCVPITPNFGEFSIRKYTDTLTTTCDADSATLWVFHDAKTEEGYSDTITKVIKIIDSRLNDSIQLIIEIESGSYNHPKSPFKSLSTIRDSISLVYSVTRYPMNPKSLQKSSGFSDIKTSPLDDFFHIHSLIIKYGDEKEFEIKNKSLN